MAITGHVSEGMKKRYTHFDTAAFTEVKRVQEKLISHGEKKAVKKAAPKKSAIKKAAAKTAAGRPVRKRNA
jgi:hypothetical protein